MGNKSIEYLDSEPSPGDFFRDYAAPRRPVVIKTILRGLAGLSRWTNKYLIDKAGEYEVKVKIRNSKVCDFAQRESLKMKFKQVVQRLASGDESLYLTTQKIHLNHNGQPNIISGPLTHLNSDFPLSPKIFGNGECKGWILHRFASRLP